MNSTFCLQFFIIIANYNNVDEKFGEIDIDIEAKLFLHPRRGCNSLVEFTCIFCVLAW